MNKTINQLKNFIQNATSPYHTVLQSKYLLEKAGFQHLSFNKTWNLEPGGKYYFIPYGTTLFAFTIGNKLSSKPAFRVTAAHTDHPCFRLKPISEMTEHNYLKLNTETYGSPILNTWLDRPLSIAGKVCLKGTSIMHPETIFFQSDRPLVTIPNLAIHLNRQVNKGIELNRQTNLNPIAGLLTETLNKKHFFIEYLAEQLHTTPENILNFDLCVYNSEKPMTVGIHQELFSSPRLDNLTSVLACINAIITKNDSMNIHIAALYDNEEIGSRTKQGADSSLTVMLQKRILESLSLPKETLFLSLKDSMILSTDVSHCLHPNYSTKNDPTTISELGKGLVIKLDSNQKYAFDIEAVSILEQILQSKNIPYQKYINRSDMAGGSTLGSILSSWLPIKTVDLGVPLLAMHSARELMAISDQSALEQALCSFLQA